MEKRCPECNAVWQDGFTCRDHFDQMLAWEFEDPGGAGAVHHLTVLCYNLQHPSVYSPEWLSQAKTLLIQMVVEGVSPQQIRKQNKQAFDSGNRASKVTGTPEAHGIHANPVHWTMTVGDVAAGGLDGYCERVEAWVRSVYEDHRASGNLP